MEDMKGLKQALKVAGSLALVCACLSLGAPDATGQIAGNKAVFNASGNCSPCASSSAFVDASVVSGANVCEKINTALKTSPAGPKVVDARGINSGMTCTGSETPWFVGGVNQILPSTVLLPAGTIVINAPWVMPDGTRIVGEGAGGELSGGGTSGTIIQANFATGTMIQMGDGGLYCPAGGHVCHGMSVEDLTLDGEGNAVNGIVNNNSQELSYVKNVKLYQVMDTGLIVSTNAQNSGPYTNITFDTGGKGPSVSTACVQIVGMNGTRGIHGLTCNSTTIAPDAAVYLDSSNNSLEDVRIAGFTDGIRVGSQATARSNVLFNVVGDTSLSTLTAAPAPITVIHVVSNTSQVSDLSMVGIRNLGGGFTINDELTGTTLTDSAVGLYVLGKPGRGGFGFSRFTTSPNAATWATGNGSPTGGCTVPANLGSLYSSTSGSGHALWVCEGPSSPSWVFVK